MALADSADVALRLGRQLTDTETARAEALIEDASAVVIGYCGQDFSAMTPVPDAVTGVVAKMVARSIGRGADGLVDQQTAGPFAVHYSAAASSGDVWLTAADKLALRPYRKGGGMTSVGLVGDRYTITEG